MSPPRASRTCKSLKTRAPRSTGLASGLLSLPDDREHLPDGQGRREAARALEGLARLVAAGAGVTLLSLAAIPALRRWTRAERTVSLASLRIGTVERGDLVRDASAQGKIVAALHPTLFAPGPGDRLAEGEGGRHGEEGPAPRAHREPRADEPPDAGASTLLSMQSALGRQRILARQAAAKSAQDIDVLEVKLSAAERLMDRADRTFKEGLLNKTDYEKAKDDLKIAQYELRNAKGAAAARQGDRRVRHPGQGGARAPAGLGRRASCSARSRSSRSRRRSTAWSPPSPSRTATRCRRTAPVLTRREPRDVRGRDHGPGELRRRPRARARAARIALRGQGIPRQGHRDLARGEGQPGARAPSSSRASRPRACGRASASACASSSRRAATSSSSRADRSSRAAPAAPPGSWTRPASRRGARSQTGAVSVSEVEIARRARRGRARHPVRHDRVRGREERPRALSVRREGEAAHAVDARNPEGLPDRPRRDARPPRLLARRRGRRVRGRDGPLGLGQDDVPQHRRASSTRSTRAPTRSTARTSAGSRTARCRASATTRSASSSRAST